MKWLLVIQHFYLAVNALCFVIFAANKSAKKKNAQGNKKVCHL